MNKEQVNGRAEQVKGHIKATWGKLTDDEITTYEGKQEAFFGSVKEKYGIAKEEAEKQIASFTSDAEKTTTESTKS